MHIFEKKPKPKYAGKKHKKPSDEKAGVSQSASYSSRPVSKESDEYSVFQSKPDAKSDVNKYSTAELRKLNDVYLRKKEIKEEKQKKENEEVSKKVAKTLGGFLFAGFAAASSCGLGTIVGAILGITGAVSLVAWLFR